MGPALNHYRCATCYFPKTRSTRVCDTVIFLPTTIKFHEVRLVDHLQQAASDIVTILIHPPSTIVPSLHAGDPVRNSLLDIATTLKKVDSISEPEKTTPVVLQ